MIYEIKLDILFLQNLFLKRISSNINDKLKGKIFLLFCDLFSIEEVSGANKNGKYSKNQLNEELSNYSNDNSDTVLNDGEAKMDIEEKINEKDKTRIDLNEFKINYNSKISGKKEKDESNQIKMISEVEKKPEIEESKESKDKEEDKNNNDSEITLSKEQNEKIKLYEQFWIIEKILINPFKVCKNFYNLYNNKKFYFIAI